MRLFVVSGENCRTYLTQRIHYSECTKQNVRSVTDPTVTSCFAGSAESGG